MELNLRFTTELTLRKFNIRKLNNMHLNKLMDHKKKLKKNNCKIFGSCRGMGMLVDS